MITLPHEWRFSHVAKDLESARVFINMNKIQEYEIVIIWDEK